jgi:hypothetical protein
MELIVPAERSKTKLTTRPFFDARFNDLGRQFFIYSPFRNIFVQGHPGRLPRMMKMNQTRVGDDSQREPEQRF